MKTANHTKIGKTEYVKLESETMVKKWQCFSCGGECELDYKGVDTKCPHGSLDHDGRVYKTDWRKIED